MPSTAQAVATYLDQDGVVREALSRGIVNQRALARWLIETKGWDATEEAVISAVRRHLEREDADRSVFDAARALFDAAHVNMRSRVGLVVAAKTQEVQERLPELFQAVDYSRGEVLRILQTDRCIKVIVDEANLASVGDLLGEDAVQEVHDGLAEINVVLPEETVTTPGVLALICTTLALHRINILEVATGLPEHLLFVAQEDARRAYETLEDLVAGTV